MEVQLLGEAVDHSGLYRNQERYCNCHSLPWTVFVCPIPLMQKPPGGQNLNWFDLATLTPLLLLQPLHFKIFKNLIHIVQQTSIVNIKCITRRLTTFIKHFIRMSHLRIFLNFSVKIWQNKTNSFCFISILNMTN